MALIGIIIFVITLVLDLYTDLRLWRRKIAVDHSRGVLIRSIGLIPSAVLLAMPPSWLIVPTVFLVGFVYWTLFDGLYNVLRGYNWWFTGTNDKDDAVTDNFLQSIPLWAHIAIKLGGIAIFLSIYIQNS